MVVSYETAELAVRKGFNIATLAFYVIGGSKEVMNNRLGKLGSYDCYSRYPGHGWEAKDVYPAPTLEELARELRDVHKIHVTGQYLKWEDTCKYYFTIEDIWNGNLVSDGDDKLFNTYEEAYHEGILEALKSL